MPMASYYEPRIRGMVLWWRVALAATWLFVVCYPDPRVLWRSIQHTVQPPVDAEAVRSWAATLPDNPAQIEQAVLDRLKYAVPWQFAGVPWSFVSPAEALAAGYGDCQARAVTFASVLAAKGIPYQLRASLDHMWVEYPGKRPNALENAGKMLWARQDRPAVDGARGIFQFRVPQIDWRESYRIEKDYFWDTAPASRKLLLLAGWLLILLLPRTRPSLRVRPPAAVQAGRLVA